MAYRIYAWVKVHKYRSKEFHRCARTFDFSTSQEFSSLQAADQLQVERAAGNVFQGFHEGEIQFPPTYKYGTFPK